VKAGLTLTVLGAGNQQERRIEKNLFRFSRGNAVFVVLSDVSIIPFEAGYLG